MRGRQSRVQPPLRRFCEATPGNRHHPRHGRRGAAVLVASSELEELTALADRIVVMRRGRAAGELSRAEASEEKLMHLATGGVD